jgi:hypothetical protein
MDCFCVLLVRHLLEPRRKLFMLSESYLANKKDKFKRKGDKAMVMLYLRDIEKIPWE